MSPQDQHVVHCYQLAALGAWPEVLSEWARHRPTARQCSRYRSPTSGWTFLHHAAAVGNEPACRELIRLGAATGSLTPGGKSAADLADEMGYGSLASLLRESTHGGESLWEPSENSDLAASSSSWGEAQERRATEDLQVGYGGGVVRISTGERYFVDSFERVLVGWHGSYDPPCGMDGEPMV